MGKPPVNVVLNLFMKTRRCVRKEEEDHTYKSYGMMPVILLLCCFCKLHKLFSILRVSDFIHLYCIDNICACTLIKPGGRLHHCDGATHTMA